MNPAEELFLECQKALNAGTLIKKQHSRDKEYHFQDWVQGRLEATGLSFDDPGRNVYPDFRLVQSPDGFEVKGLAYPGRVASYDANSQMPSGVSHGREIYYVFGRYPAVVNENEYPVVDLVVFHGSFLNADSTYVHKNKSIKGFGTYGDVMIRDRKMYVVPTPFHLLEGVAGLATLILPEGVNVNSSELAHVGDIERIESDQLISSYEFDLRTNELKAHKIPNPNAGVKHSFKAYRMRGNGESTPVSLKNGTLPVDPLDSEDV